MKTIEEMRARCLAIVALITTINESEALSDENHTEINTLSAEFDGLRKNIEAKEKMAAITASASASAPKVAPMAPAGNTVVSEPKVAKNFGYKQIGNFFKDVAKKGMGGDVSANLKNAAAVEKIGEDGGFLVATDFMSEIQKKVQGDESLLPLTRQFTTGSNNLSLPINESAPWDTTGVQAYWEGEAKTYRDSKPEFSMENFRLHKLTAYVPVSEELLEDATALQSFLQQEATAAIMHKVNSAILSGTGSGMPKGILNSGFGVTVDAEGGQAADTIVYENIVKMYSHALPAARARGVWIYNPACEEQLRQMKFVTGAASPVPAYLPPGGLNDSPYGSLMGRPVIPLMGSTEALGDKGDIRFVDLSYFYSVLKTGGIEQFMSTHVHFDSDLVAFKFRIRLAGACPFKTPVVTEKGAYQMSGLIDLAAR